MSSKNVKVICNAVLVLIAFIWGATFIFQKMAVNAGVGTFTFMASRYFLGSSTIALIILFIESRKTHTDLFRELSYPSYSKDYMRRLFTVAPLCCLTNVTGSILQQYAMIYTTATKTAFLTAIYIVFVPLAGFFMYKKRTGVNVLAALVLAVIGLYNLCITESFTIAKGDLLILISTVLFGIHIQLISKYVHEFVGMHFTCVEFLTGFILSGILAVLFEQPSWSDLAAAAPSVLYSGILGTGICYGLQATAQKYTDPTVAALIMSLETVFGALLGMAVLHEMITVKEGIGVVFVLAAIVIAQLPERLFHFKKKAED